MGDETMTTLVREFSAAGPCLTLGQFVRRTAKTIVYREWLGGESFGKERRARRLESQGCA